MAIPESTKGCRFEIEISESGHSNGRSSLTIQKAIVYDDNQSLLQVKIVSV